MTRNLIPVIDLTTLLTMAFLFAGNLVGVIQGQERRPEPPPVTLAPAATASPRPPRDVHHAAAPAAADEAPALPPPPAPEPEDARTKLAETIAKAREALALLAADIDAARAQIELLKHEVAARARHEEELRRIATDLADRTAELERLEQEKQTQLQRLAELQAALASAEQKATATTGAPLVRRDRKATETLALLLAASRVFPLRRGYFVAQRRPDGSVVVWPREGQQGLTVEEALRPGSEVLKEVTRPEFQRGGRVVMLVNPDSFDTFRALRDAVARAGADWGWEPHEGRRIVSSDRGQPIDSQGQER